MVFICFLVCASYHKYLICFDCRIQKTKEDVFKDIRKANGKQTVSDVVSEALENVLKK